jgi:hypothetical protein
MASEDTITIGYNVTNNDNNTCLLGIGLGGNALANIRVNSDGVCDLGTASNRFKDVSLSNRINVSDAGGNVKIGLLSGNALTTGANSVYIGENTGLLCTDTADTVLIGRNAGSTNDIADRVVAIGSGAGSKCQNPETVAIGYNSMLGNNASFNTAVGSQAQSVVVSSGSTHNTSLGYSAGPQGGSCVANLALGSLCKSGSGNSHAVALGFNVTNNESNSVLLASSSNYTNFRPNDNVTSLGTATNRWKQGHFSDFLELSDISAPANPADGRGRLYKKSGDVGLFWKPDSAGTEVDLTNVIGNYETQLSADADVTVTDGVGRIVISDGTATGAFALIGPSAVAGQMLVVVNNDATHATTGIVVGALSAATTTDTNSLIFSDHGLSSPLTNQNQFTSRQSRWIL